MTGPAPAVDYTLGDHSLREADEYAKAKFRLTLDWLRDRPAGTRLANIGCGSGVFTKMAADAGFSVAAFEPDRAAGALAARSLPEGATLELLPLEAIDGEGRFDVVVMHDVLEHIPDDAAAVGHLRRLVATGGRVVLSVPAMPSLYGHHDEQLHHVRRYTRRSLRAVVEPHFDVVRLRSFGFLLIPVTLYYSRWRRRPYPVARSAEPGATGRMIRAVCTLERRLPMPLGTSILCELTPR